jgi:hypothetical protein
MEIPNHFKKFVADYTTNKIKAKDVIMTGDPETPESLEFEISLPTFDSYGDPTGKLHVFKVGVASLVETKVRANAEADAIIATVDEFNTTYDTFIEILNTIKVEKTK